MTPPDNLLPKGTRLNNLYEIEEHIADGGIGTVYRARDVESGDPVAIKVLLASFARDQMIVDLFRREAKILKKLTHEALTQYFVFAKEPELGIYYLAMEFVAGPSLSSRLEQGALEPEAAYRLLKRLAEALQAVHDCQVIHRDLSPDNIILQNGDVGQAKIIDFGISKSKASGPTIIGDGFAGKVNYVSPEQVGIFDGKVTSRSDIYSLGLVIAESLTGKQLDMGGTQAQIVEKRRILPPLEGIDLRFQPLLEAMLQPDPANRPASMREIANWTMGAPMQSGIPDKTVIQFQPGPPPEQELLDQDLAKPNWPRRILLGLSLIGFAGLGAAGVFFIAGPTVEDTGPERPFLAATPRENAPEAPDQPPDPEPVPAVTPEPPKISPDIQDTAGQQAPEDKSQDEQIIGNLQDRTNVIIEQSVKPADPAPSTDQMTPEDRIRKYVTGYKSGECMYLQPVKIAANSAEIEGFAARTPPFIAFDGDFKKSQGFEATIQANLVTDAQCAAVTFLRATPQGTGRTELQLDMQRTVVPNGSNMAGRISGFDPAAGDLGLIIVASDGQVSNLSAYLLSDDGGAGFVIPLQLNRSTEETGLIIALVGKNLQSALASAAKNRAASFFEGLERDGAVLRATATTIKVLP
ncbi:protein kinase domain-containing protein [Roseibium sp.]|uniref:serine/threonine-protein kinase n=1 Tax=Roseibium sp. TaxID=1936156 RepID=UPI003B528577